MRMQAKVRGQCSVFISPMEPYCACAVRSIVGNAASARDNCPPVVILPYPYGGADTASSAYKIKILHG